MAKNPFSYGSPVSAPHFAGRHTELQALVSRMENGINVVVTAPRRYGKTSLVVEAAKIIAKGDGGVVRANLLRTPSLETLGSRLVTELYHLNGGPWRRATQAVPEFLRRIRLKPGVAYDGVGCPNFTFAPGFGPADARQLIEDVYKVLAEIGTKRAAVLILDEFQAITDTGPEIPGLLKALADQYPGVSLVMAGSKQHLMEALVLSEGAPLYNMAERLSLGPIERGVMCKFLQARAKAGGKPMTADAAELIHMAAGPIPHDIQRLAYEVFDLATGGIDIAAVDAGLALVAAHEGEAHAERFARLSPGHRRVVVELARSEIKHVQSGFFAVATGYSNPAGAGKAVRALLEDETVVKRDGIFVVADPFFRAWLLQGG